MATKMPPPRPPDDQEQTPTRAAEQQAAGSAAPERSLPKAEWEHFHLYNHVREAILALPNYFTTETRITGIRATDIFTLSSTLGATIEDQVVQTLNRMRPVWDPDGKYNLYRFVRQGQTFPDVLLRKKNDGQEIILGIELKGWYLLAKEREPSFRYKVTPEACAPQDLVVVVPWTLSDVLSGSPTVFDPYIESAKYAAEYRNYWWQHVRVAAGSKAITKPTGITPYPKKSDKISDVPKSDDGNNFGRFSRSGIMDRYEEQALATPICGIPAGEWVAFFKKFEQ
ncbi:MAG: hypothetical protein ABSG52_08655 [Terriglobales bacterium]|jgi:hypothetical protein